MASAAEIARQGRRDEVRSRWLLSAPALIIIFVAAIGPLFVMLLYSFMVKGDYGDVKFWQFSLDGWFSVLFERDIFDDTLQLADAHLSICLALDPTVLHHHGADAGRSAFRPPISSPRGHAQTREIWVFLVTIPFWTNLLIRTFAMQQVIRNEGILNSLLTLGRHHRRAAADHVHRLRRSCSAWSTSTCR